MNGRPCESLPTKPEDDADGAPHRLAREHGLAGEETGRGKRSTRLIEYDLSSPLTSPRLHPWPHRCAGCGLPQEHCLCALIPRVACQTPIVVVRHVAERKKASNTGGLTALVLGCPLVDHGDPGPPTDLTPFLRDRPRVLAPQGSTELSAPPSCVVVLDGTWSQARRMRARVPSLREVPAWTLPDAPVRDRMRRPHLPDGLSTMEAVAAALDRLGEPEPARALRTLYDELVRRWLTLRLGRGYAG